MKSENTEAKVQESNRESEAQQFNGVEKQPHELHSSFARISAHEHPTRARREYGIGKAEREPRVHKIYACMHSALSYWLDDEELLRLLPSIFALLSHLPRPTESSPLMLLGGACPESARAWFESIAAGTARKRRIVGIAFDGADVSQL